MDASGRFKQATLQLGGGAGSGGKASGSGAGGKASGGGPGGGKASGGGLGFGMQKQQQQQPKKKIFATDGAWNGCCYCGVRAKVGARHGEGMAWHGRGCSCVADMLHTGPALPTAPCALRPRAEAAGEAAGAQQRARVLVLRWVERCPVSRGGAPPLV